MASPRMEWRGDLITAEQHGKMPGALLKAAEYLLEEADRTIPIEEGTLERTGQASAGFQGRAGAAAHVSYGTPYAVIQHEATDFRHAAGRRAKWLELTFEEQREHVWRMIAKDVGVTLE